MINYDTSRGVSVKNDRSGSTLVIARALADADGGNYTCSPYNVRPSSVVVHVVGQEKGGKGGGPAEAVHEGNGGGGGGAAAAAAAADTPPSAAVQSNEAPAAIEGSQLIVFITLVALLII